LIIVSDKYQALAEQFVKFARSMTATTKLYQQLCDYISTDESILKLVASNNINNQPPQNILLGAVHYLLLKGVKHDLRHYYPSIVGQDNVWKNGSLTDIFTDFCHIYADQLADIIRTRIVQTNEVKRCTSLIPGFKIIVDENPDQPLAVIEIGCSAALNLGWDTYAYRYDGHQIGNPNSPLILDCEIRGAERPPLLEKFPEVVTKVGIDLNPLDRNDPDDQLWLQALVWPDQLHRLERLRTAFTVEVDDELTIIKGNAVEKLPEVIDSLPEDVLICVFQTVALYLFAEKDKHQLYRILQEKSLDRDIYFLMVRWEKYFEQDRTDFRLRLEKYQQGQRQIRELAKVHYHGDWIDWSAFPDEVVKSQD